MRSASAGSALISRLPTRASQAPAGKPAPCKSLASVKNPLFWAKLPLV